MITCKQYPEILFLCFFMTICCLGNPIVTEDSESSAITNGVRCIISHNSRHGISFVTAKNHSLYEIFTVIVLSNETICLYLHHVINVM